eukprot:COSAG01_NODE_38438_length_489_cov_1.723077_2_plen_70_part_01
MRIVTRRWYTLTSPRISGGVAGFEDGSASLVLILRMLTRTQWSVAAVASLRFTVRTCRNTKKVLKNGRKN